MSQLFSDARVIPFHMPARLSCWPQCPPHLELDADASSNDDVVLDAMRDILKRHGSPERYLGAMLGDATQRASFSEWLWMAFPEKDDIIYEHADSLTYTSDESELAKMPPMCFHVSQLGYHPSTSLKADTGGQTAMLLVEQYLKDGFMTQLEPLLITQPNELRDAMGCDVPWAGTCRECAPLMPHSLGYVKGKARSTSLLMMLHWAMGAKFDLPTMFLESARVVYGHALTMKSKMDEAMMNMKMSVRGSIRKAPNVIQTVIMMKNIMKCSSLDAGSFVRKWNAMSGRLNQIIGLE